MGYTKVSIKKEDIQDELSIINSSNKNFIIAIIDCLYSIVSFILIMVRSMMRYCEYNKKVYRYIKLRLSILILLYFLTTIIPVFNNY